MDIWQAIILSIVEGVTEFLPVSSTGHLNLTRVLLGIPNTEFFTTFEIFIQLGAILAVVVLYWRTLFTNQLGWKKVLAAFVPTAIVGFLFGNFILQNLTSNEYVTLIALFAGGVLLIILELLYKEQKHHVGKIEEISYKNAVLIGLCQSLAVVPGVSRSAASIMGAMFLGVKRVAAVEFSFLLAVPTMLAASVFDLKEANFHFTGYELLLLAVGFAGSFIVAFLAIKWLISFVRTNTFIPFGIYRIALALFFWLVILG